MLCCWVTSWFAPDLCARAICAGRMRRGLLRGATRELREKERVENDPVGKRFENHQDRRGARESRVESGWRECQSWDCQRGRKKNWRGAAGDGRALSGRWARQAIKREKVESGRLRSSEHLPGSTLTIVPKRRVKSQRMHENRLNVRVKVM
jgi:hypothetical protein